MKRIANLSAGGDVLIASLVLKLWNERWRDEVDHMIINYNNHANAPQSAVSEFLSTVSADPNVDIIYHPTGCGNGTPIREGTLIAPQDSLIMLLEDDGLAFTPGVIDKCFQQIESDLCDAVGSPRGSCGVEVWDAAQKKYNLDYSGYGDQGPTYWPNFFFAKRKDLLRTDMDFGSHTWQPGEYSKELDHTFKEVNHGDTFVWASVQLRYLGVRFHNVPQFHASPTEIEDVENHTMNWIGEKPYWLHGGSLSSGWGGYLSNQVPDVSTDGAKQEIESRVAFWSIAANVVDGYKDFKYDYQRGIENLINNAVLDRDRIGKKVGIYRNLMQI